MFKNRSSNPGALLLLVAMVPLHAGEALRNGGDAAAVLGRYFAGGGRAEWSIESVDVDAALPRIAKGARRRAIRRLQPDHQKKYEVL